MREMDNTLSDDVMRDIPITDAEEETIVVESESNHKQQGSSIIPLQYRLILRDSDTAIAEDRLTEENLYRLLHGGVYLDQKRKKFWLDEQSRKNCFELYARGLAITWSDTSLYWRWIYLKDAPGGDLIEVAELVNVCWLEARARFNTLALSQQTTYRVVFIVMIKAHGYGWHVPVNVRLVLPDGSRHEHKVRLDEMPREKWLEITAGEITTRSENDATTSSEMEVSMFEFKGGNWKSGILIKGVVIRPKE